MIVPLCGADVMFEANYSSQEKALKIKGGKKIFSSVVYGGHYF